MRIALTGNPNSGKTTMYNALTGRNEKVGNWAGVTVAKKEHPIKKAYDSGSKQLIAVDLPGAYSMSPFTSEEKWLWGGIGLQLGVGYTVGYLVYTVGTLLTAPASLNVGAALAGLAVVAVFVGTIITLIRNTDKSMKWRKAYK